MQSRMKKVSLFLLGCVLGVAGFGSYKKTLPWISGTQPVAHSDDKLALAACTTQPSSKDDAILFISCGGIY